MTPAGVGQLVLVGPVARYVCIRLSSASGRTFLAASLGVSSSL